MIEYDFGLRPFILKVWRPTKRIATQARLSDRLRALAIMSVTLLMLPVIAEARGIIIPVPEEDAPTGVPRTAPVPVQGPEPRSDRESTAPSGATAQPRADRLCAHDQCRHGTVWHVTNRSNKSCLDLSTADLGSDGDIAKLGSLLPSTTFVIAAGGCAR